MNSSDAVGTSNKDEISTDHHRM